MTVLVETGMENEFAADVERSYFVASEVQPAVYPVVATDRAGVAYIDG